MFFLEIIVVNTRTLCAFYQFDASVGLSLNCRTTHDAAKTTIRILCPVFETRDKSRVS